MRFVGATLHLATEQPDCGPIVAQVCAPAWPACSQAHLAQLSFVQRVYFFSLLAVEFMHDGALAVSPADGTVRYRDERPFSDRSNPALRDDGMHALEDERGLRMSR